MAEAEKKQAAVSGHGLAFVLFLATLFGSLIGVAADLSDAKELLYEVITHFDPDPTLVVAGSDTILGEKLGLAESWSESFRERSSSEQLLPVVGAIERRPNLEILPVGSHRGLELALEGRVHLLAMSDPMSRSEQDRLSQAGITIRCAGQVGYDIIVFVSDLNNYVPVFSKFAVGAIFQGFIQDWSQVSDDWSGLEEQIRVLARYGSGTTALLLRRFINDDDFPEHFIECASNEDCLNRALTTPGSIYWVSAAWLRTQPKRYVRTLLIRREGGLPPSDPFNPEFNPNNYPEELIRALYFYVLEGAQIEARSSELAKELFLYARSLQGQEQLEEHNFSTLFKAPAEVEIDLPEGFGLQESGQNVICKR